MWAVSWVRPAEGGGSSVIGVPALAWASFQVSRDLNEQFPHRCSFSKEEDGLWKTSSLFVIKLKYDLWALRSRSSADALVDSFQQLVCSWKKKMKPKPRIFLLNLVRKRSGASDRKYECRRVRFEGRIVRTNYRGIWVIPGKMEEACSLSGFCVSPVDLAALTFSLTRVQFLSI